MTISRATIGAGLVVLSACVFSATTVATVIAYEGGANPTSVIAIRFAGAIVVLFVLLKVTGVNMRLTPRDRNIAFVLGAIQALQSYCLYTSFDHIPVGLTMIIFYIYPLMIGIIAASIGQDRLTWRLVVGLVGAFIGLMLVFNVSTQGLRSPGVIYAALAAVCWSTLVVASTTLIRGRDSRPVTLHTQLSACVLFGIYLLIAGDAQLPTTQLGWVGFLSTPLFYAVAVTSFFAAVAMIGSVRASLIMNSEPVATITLGYLILGQVLTPLQLVGAGFVIAALVASRWRAVQAEKPT